MRPPSPAAPEGTMAEPSIDRGARPAPGALPGAPPGAPPGARLRARAARLAAALPRLLGAGAYAAAGAATLGGTAPGALLAGASGRAAADGSWRPFAVAVLELVGAVTLVDADASPITSVGLAVLMAGAAAAAVARHAAPADAVLLLAAALLVAWSTRAERGRLRARARPVVRRVGGG
jgi:hypothetical protein